MHLYDISYLSEKRIKIKRSDSALKYTNHGQGKITF